MRLKEARKAARMTQAEVAKILGVNQNTYSYWETGKTKIDNISLSKLAEIFNVSIDYLLDIQPPVKGVRVPIYGSVPAGIPLEAIENIEGYEEITPALASKGEYFALKIKGESMSPFILNNDIVIVRKQSEIESGDIAIVLVNGDEATCKTVKISDDGITLIGHNTLVYPPHFYSQKEIATLPVRIIGRVVEVKRSLI
jgi:repressor LexA